jgi:hypothetical protein
LGEFFTSSSGHSDLKQCSDFFAAQMQKLFENLSPAIVMQ